MVAVQFLGLTRRVWSAGGHDGSQLSSQLSIHQGQLRRHAPPPPPVPHDCRPELPKSAGEVLHQFDTVPGLQLSWLMAAPQIIDPFLHSLVVLEARTCHHGVCAK